MAYTSGTATDYKDLLVKLEAFLTGNASLVADGQAWTTLRFANGPSPQAFPFSTLSFKLSGADGLFTNGTPGDFPSTYFKMAIYGTLTVPTTGTYTIAIDGDESLEVLIDGDLAVGWYGSHGASGGWTHNEQVPLTAGTHSIQVNLVQGAGDYAVTVGWQKPGDGSIAAIPAGNLSGLTYQWAPYSGGIPGSGAEMANLWAEKELIMKAPGLSGTEEIYLGIRPYQNVAGDYYNWQLNGFVGYASGYTFDNQPYKSPNKYVYLWNSTIPYWFFANGQRVIVVAKVSNTYQTLYMGKFLHYGLPTQYPYPVLISGTDDVFGQRWSALNYNVGNIQNPGNGSTLYYTDAVWKTVRNRYEQSGSYTWDNLGVNVWPCQNSSDQTPMTDSLSWPDNGYTLLPLILNSASPTNVLGEVDGAYWVSGHQNSSENVITIGGTNYFCVHNVYRTSRGEYMALRMA